MALFDLETSLTLNQDGNSTPDIVDPFRNALSQATGGAVASSILTFTGQPSDGDLFEYGGKTYKVQTVLTDVDGNVLIGADLAETIRNLVRASLLGTGAGTLYAASTTAHPNSAASTASATTMEAVALEAGTGGNALTTTETSGAASWTGATMAGGVSGTIDVKALSNPVSGTANAAVLLGSGGGGVDFAFDSATRTTLPGDNLLFTMPFGMEVDEFLSWWFETGATLHRELTDEASIDLVQFPIAVRAAEAGGWFKEPVTLKMMQTGKYTTGEQVNYRGFGEAVQILNRVFPNVGTPASTPTVSPLQDFINGVFNAIEFSSPIGDASVIAGVFPNFPAVDGSIIAAGAKDYYVSSWHTPYRGRVLWVNKPFFDGLSPSDRNRIEAAARASSMSNVATSLSNQDALIKQFQTLGATIHKELPHDVISLLQQGANEIYEENADADGTGASRALLDSMQNHAKKNQIRWAASTGRREARFKWTNWRPDLSLG